MPAHAAWTAMSANRSEPPARASQRPSAPRGQRLGNVAPGEILFRTDPRHRLRSIIVVDAVIAGPALGGCSLVRDIDDPGALALALHRARAATRQAALADLPFGGGHAVLIEPDGPFDRTALFGSFGESVSLAHGRFIATEDTGCRATDMRAVRSRTRFASDVAASSILGSNPAPATAFGLFVAIEAALVRLRIGLARATVAVHGLDATALALCERLHDAGVRLVLADADPVHANNVARRFDASIAGEHVLSRTACDVLVPCSRRLARLVEPSTRLVAPIVCGTAADPLADALHVADGSWLPDDLVGCGGLVAATRNFLQPAEGARVVEEIARIDQRVHEFIDRRAARPSPVVVDEWIAEKLAARTPWKVWQTIPQRR